MTAAVPGFMRVFTCRARIKLCLFIGILFHKSIDLYLVPIFITSSMIVYKIRFLTFRTKTKGANGDVSGTGQYSVYSVRKEYAPNRHATYENIVEMSTLDS